VGLASLDVPKREALPTKPTQHPDADHASTSGQLALTPVGHQEALPYPSGNPHGPPPKGPRLRVEWRQTSLARSLNHIQERRYIEVVGRSVVIGLDPL
jgi:hypothetical protein